MAYTYVEGQIKVQQIFLFGAIVVMTLFMGFFLAADMMSLAVVAGGVIWLALLPFHSKLAIYLSVAAFNSAFLIPFFPGRPFLWEFAALLGWTGLIISISMRQYDKNYARLILDNRWLFISLLTYCAVLVVTMMFRGVGLRVLGSDMMGGRYYFQQLACAVFPFLFALININEKTLVRLYAIQCILTVTYVISDLIITFMPGKLIYLLLIFEIPGDATNFARMANNFGFRRFQSLYLVSVGFLLLLFLRYPLRDFIRRRGFWLMPLSIIFVGVGLLSGHRYLIMILTITVFFIAYSQRFFTFHNILITVTCAMFLLIAAYAVADRLPLAAQRTLSVLPGIDIDTQARNDGLATLDTRRMLRKVGMDLIPDYLLLGRGFGLPKLDLSINWDQSLITWYINQGRFFNGFIGLMVNTGLFGTLAMLAFLTMGAILSWKLFQFVRTYGCEDNFSRLCSVLASLWYANIIAFLFFHGDSELALKTFSLQAGLLLACYRNIQKRKAAALAQPSIVKPPPLQIIRNIRSSVPPPYANPALNR